MAPIGLLLWALVPASPFAQESPHPGNFNLTPRQRAETFLYRKEYEKAVEAFQTLLEKGGGESPVFRGLVRAYRGSGRLQEAEKFLKEYLRVHPASSPAHYGLGYSFYLMENDSAAMEQFDEALRLDPKNALAWNNRGASLARTKSYTFAVKSVKEAIRLEPSNPMYYKNLLAIYQKMGEPGLFFAEFREYVKGGSRLLAQGYGKTLAVTLRQEAFGLYAKGKLDASIAKFSEMVKIYREIEYTQGLVPGYFGLGILFEEKGDQEKAQDYFRKVLSINPNHIQAREKVKNN